MARGCVATSFVEGAEVWRPRQRSQPKPAPPMGGLGQEPPFETAIRVVLLAALGDIHHHTHRFFAAALLAVLPLPPVAATPLNSRCACTSAAASCRCSSTASGSMFLFVSSTTATIRP
jgi:hypothetical protein